jgi:hypothetical protein
LSNASGGVLLDAGAEVFSSETTEKTVCVIDEKHGVFDIVLLGEFGEKSSCDWILTRKKP